MSFGMTEAHTLAGAELSKSSKVDNIECINGSLWPRDILSMYEMATPLVIFHTKQHITIAYAENAAPKLWDYETDKSWIDLARTWTTTQHIWTSEQSADKDKREWDMGHQETEKAR